MRPVEIQTADGAVVRVDLDRTPQVVSNAVIAAAAWSDGADRRGLVGVPCTTPRCERHLAVTPPRRPDAVYVCAAAMSGYCRAMHNRRHPGLTAEQQGPAGPDETHD